MPRRNVVYVLDYNALTVAHLGDLDHVPSQSMIDALGPVDIALVPVGGGSGLSSGQAAEVISLLEPSIVIPMHFRVPGLSIPLDTPKRFLNELGVEEPEKLDVLNITRTELGEEAPESARVVLLDLKQ